MDLGSSLQRFHIDVRYQNLRNLMVMTNGYITYYFLILKEELLFHIKP